MHSNIPTDAFESSRFFYRCWTRADAPRYKAALDRSLPELQKWIPWAMDEPSDIEVLEKRLDDYFNDFHAGRNALYAIMNLEQTEILGQIGLYRRIGPGALELGYWIRSDQAGRGIATEATAALTPIGLAVDGIERIEIRCDPKNAASAAVPRKCGYRLREIATGLDTTTAGEPRETMIWEMTTEAFRHFTQKSKQ